jgi:hypothetical protein
MRDPIRDSDYEALVVTNVDGLPPITRESKGFSAKR